MYDHQLSRWDNGTYKINRKCPHVHLESVQGIVFFFFLLFCSVFCSFFSFRFFRLIRFVQTSVTIMRKTYKSNLHRLLLFSAIMHLVKNYPPVSFTSIILWAVFTPQWPTKCQFSRSAHNCVSLLQSYNLTHLIERFRICLLQTADVRFGLTISKVKTVEIYFFWIKLV